MHHLYGKQFIFPMSMSAIWSSFRKISHIFANGLAWHFGNGQNILIHGDKIAGMSDFLSLSPGLSHRLTHKGIFYLS